MSLESILHRKPNPCFVGEGCQDWTLANPGKTGRGHNDRWSNHHHGGVGGHGRRELVTALRDEISGGGFRNPTAGTSGQTARPVWSPEKSERSIVAAKVRNGTGAKGPHLVDENSVAKEAGDGS